MVTEIDLDLLDHRRTPSPDLDSTHKRASAKCFLGKPLFYFSHILRDVRTRSKAIPKHRLGKDVIQGEEGLTRFVG